jgi:hypothetical protein
MNTDIRLSVSFKGHRKRKRLKMLIGADGVLCLIDLWLGVAMSNPNGMLVAWDEHDLAFEAGWEGDPVKFVGALVECRFLEKLPGGGFKIHDWEDHQGYVIHAQERSERAKKAATARWERKENQHVDATSMQQVCGEHAESMLKSGFSNAPSPAPSPAPAPIPIVKEKDIAPASKSKRFIPPSVEDVSEYCLERKNNIDPQYWWDSYQAKNWMVGKNKMSDWKAAVRTWEGKNYCPLPEKKTTINGINF